MLKLDPEYYVTADERQVILHHRYKPTKPPINGKPARETTEEVIGYYSSLLHAIQAYRRVMERTFINDSKTIPELIEKMEALDAKIVKGMKFEKDPPPIKEKELTEKLKAEKAKGGKRK